MLTFESLIEQAKIREMPPAKLRGILREYVQILILKELYRTEAGKKLYFTGGTYLRLVHHLKRFSEDLDFNAHKTSKRDFENLQGMIKTELKRVGMDTDLRFGHWENVYVAKFIFPKIEKAYDVVSQYSRKEGIMIKVEANNPDWPIVQETQMISGFGEFYPCVCTRRGVLFADKIDALIKKTRGRHLYDIMFILSNRYPVDSDMCKALGMKKDPFELVIDRVKSFSKTDLKKQAENLRPFLFDEGEADLLIQAHTVIPQLIEQYKSA